MQRAEIRRRVLANLAHVDHRLASQVADGLGLAVPPEAEPNHGRRSPALSQETQPRVIATRKVAVLAADGVDAASLQPVLRRLSSEGVVCEILAPHGGELTGAIAVDRPLQTMASVLYDAVLIANGERSVEILKRNGSAVRYVAEAFKHAKPIGAIAGGIELLREAPLNGVWLSEDGLVVDAGIVTIASAAGPSLDDFAAALADAIGSHRHFDRRLDLVPA